MNVVIIIIGVTGQLGLWLGLTFVVGAVLATRATVEKTVGRSFSSERIWAETREFVTKPRNVALSIRENIVIFGPSTKIDVLCPGFESLKDFRSYLSVTYGSSFFSWTQHNKLGRRLSNWAHEVNGKRTFRNVASRTNRHGSGRSCPTIFHGNGEVPFDDFPCAWTFGAVDVYRRGKCYKSTLDGYQCFSVDPIGLKHRISLLTRIARITDKRYQGSNFDPYHRLLVVASNVAQKGWFLLSGFFCLLLGWWQIRFNVA